MGEPSYETGIARALARLGVHEGPSRLFRRAEGLAAMGTAVWEAASGNLVLSEGAATLLGITRVPGPTPGTLLELVHPDDRDRLRHVAEHVERAKQPVTFRVVRPAGGVRQMRLDWEEVRSESGALAGLVANLLDVTEHLELIDSLGENEALWKSVAMNPADFVVLVDRDGVFRWINRVGPGVHPDQVIGKQSLWNWVGPESEGEVRAAIARCFELALPAYYETYVPHLDAWFSSAMGPVVRNGRTVLASVVSHDISEARRAVQELRRRERMLAEAQRIGKVGSFYLDIESQRIDWSAEMFRIFGVSPDARVDEALFLERVHPDDRERVRSGVALAIEVGAADSEEFRIVRARDGVVRHLQTTAEVVRDAAGKKIGLMGTSLDVTDRRELEADLAQSRKLEALGRLAGGIAHDFNNVMTAILGNAELAVRDLPAGSAAAENLDAIRAAGERASSLTRQLLAFARRQIIAPKVCAPNPLIESVARLFQPLLGDDVRLTLALAPNAWPIKIDVGQFEQLIMNLAVNARDAMPGGGTLRIETRNVTVDRASEPADLAPGDYVAISVADTGQGIPAELRAHVFEPFFTTKPTGRGTGLGLATCHGIVKQNGGHIWLESAPGRGTRAFVYLPRGTATGGDSLPLEPVTRSAPVTGSETVLVLEDEPMVRGLAVRSLQALGYKVLDAASGDAAIEVARAHRGPIHLLFCDVMLPGRRGPEVVAGIAPTHPETRVLFTSGYTDDQAVTSGVGSASVRFLHKPYTLAALAAAVREAIDG